VNARSYAALLLIAGTALACRNETRSSPPPSAAAPSAPAGESPARGEAPLALTAPASARAPSAAPAEADYDALCSAFCGAAEAFQNGPPQACDGVDPSCASSCLATGKTIDARCGAAYREMFECFISSNSWTCGGSPSTPIPASCNELQQRVEQCLSVEPG